MPKMNRKRYLIHPSSQLKYIAMSVLPALIMSIFFVQLTVKSGQVAMEKEKKKVYDRMASVSQTVSSTVKLMSQDKYSGAAKYKISDLLNELISLQKSFQDSYFNTVRQWIALKKLIFLAIFIILIFIAFMALMYSHRIAGPIYRLKKDVDKLVEGRDIPPIKLRKNDEFRELAESLERLRKKIRS